MNFSNLKLLFISAIAITITAGDAMARDGDIHNHASICKSLLGDYATPVMSPAGYRITPLFITTSRGQFKFKVEQALSEQQKAKGLMYRRQLDKNHGMIFYYQTPQNVNMWMKNTYLSLDMVFINAEGKVSHIADNTKPKSQKIISSNGKVKAVIELTGGTARRIDIKKGDSICHFYFSN